METKGKSDQSINNSSSLLNNSDSLANINYFKPIAYYDSQQIKMVIKYKKAESPTQTLSCSYETFSPKKYFPIKSLRIEFHKRWKLSIVALSLETS